MSEPEPRSPFDCQDITEAEMIDQLCQLLGRHGWEVTSRIVRFDDDGSLFSEHALYVAGSMPDHRYEHRTRSRVGVVQVAQFLAGSLRDSPDPDS